MTRARAFRNDDWIYMNLGSPPLHLNSKEKVAFFAFTLGLRALA